MTYGETIVPAVYVGTYAKFNNGSLFGAWLKLEDYDSAHEFMTAARDLHHDEGAPELMFQDYEGIHSASMGESWIDCEYWDFLDAEGDMEAKVAFIEWCGSWDEEVFIDRYQGTCYSKLEFTYQLVDDIGYLSAVPEQIARYFDYESFCRDLFLSDYAFVDGYVFLNC